MLLDGAVQGSVSFQNMGLERKSNSSRPRLEAQSRSGASMAEAAVAERGWSMRIHWGVN